jgi:hypothetical protein
VIGLTIQAGRGQSRASKPFGCLLADLSVTMSHLRPHCTAVTSPISEAEPFRVCYAVARLADGSWTARQGVPPPLHGEITLGAALLTPFVPSTLAGAALTAFS